MKPTLLFDFNNYNGHQMIVSNKHGFYKDDIDQLELKMHTSNRIPSFLSLSWLELDGAISFHYHIEGYRLLHQYIRTRKLTMQAYYSLILSLADGLSTCYEYMLRPECCLLDDNYIFFDEAKEQVYLVYVPTKVSVQEQQEQQLLSIIVKWSNLVTDLDTAGYHRLLNLLTSEQFQILKLRQLVLDLIHQLQLSEYGDKVNTNQSSDSVHSNTLKASSIPSDEVTKKEKTNGSNRVNNSPSSNSSSRGNSSDKEPLSYRFNEASNEKGNRIVDHLKGNFTNVPNDVNIQPNDDWLEEDYDNAGERLTWKHGLLVIVILIGIVVSWQQFYISSPHTKSLLLCIGITLALIALLAILLYKPILAVRLQKQQKDDEVTDRESGEISSTLLSSLSIIKENSVSAGLVSNEQSKERNSSIKSGQIHFMYNDSEPHHIKNVSNDVNQVSYEQKKSNAAMMSTVKLSPQQATELLAGVPTLIRSWHEEQQSLTVSDKFIIGRTEEGVHFQDTAVGVSRVHIELECERGKITVKDVGSRNGTYLNGQLMIAYKSYSLQIGDQLQLASSEGPIYERVS